MANYDVNSRVKHLMKLKDIEVRTRSVEETLTPLIKQVATLQEFTPGRYQHKQFRNVHKLIQIVIKATENFINVAEQVAADNPDFQEELWLSCEEVRSAGQNIQTASTNYAADSLQPRKREGMEIAAKELMLAVTRLLVLIDLIDINELLKASSQIEAKLRQLRLVDTWEGFVDTVKSVTKEIKSVSELATARQQELKSSAAQQLIVAANTELKQCNKMLITSTKMFLEHPQDEYAHENRDYIINRMQEAIRTIARLADGEDPILILQQQEDEEDIHHPRDDKEGNQQQEQDEQDETETPTLAPPQTPVPPHIAPSIVVSPKSPSVPRGLAKSIQNFETLLERSAECPPPIETPRHLQAGFDVIMAAAANLATSDSTRDQHGLLAQCDVVREKLQDFLAVISAGSTTEIPSDREDDVRGEGDGNEGETEGPLSPPSSPSLHTVHQTMSVVEEETATLRSELRRAMIDHVSDTLVDPFVPLKRMVTAAEMGNIASVEECSAQFISHAEQLAHVANLVCSLTVDGPGTRFVRVASQQVSSLKQQVVCAAKMLAAHPMSETAQKNMTAFQEAWIDKLTLLTDAVDAVIPLQDFIAVTEAHVREDSRHLIETLEIGDVEMATSCAKLIQGRCQRLMQVVLSDIGDHPTRYSHEHVHQIEQQMKKLREKTLVEFQEAISSLCEKRKTQHLYESELRKLEDHLQLINDSVRDIRRCVLKTRTKAELEAEPDADDLMSPGLLTGSSSNVSLDTDLDPFLKNQCNFNDNDAVITTKFPSPILKRHGGLSPHPLEIQVEEVELTSEQYAMMVSYSSPGSIQLLEDIMEEDEDEEDTDKEDEKEKTQEDQKEEFKGDDGIYMTNTLQRRLIKRTPSTAIINESETAQALMAQLPAHEQAKIAEVQKKLNVEKKKLESEVNQWDDSSNDIVLLAKEMCWMMMDMSDFTRGVGPLKTTMDVINTAKDIARAGEYLNRLAKQVADQCPDVSCRKDLLAYLERVKLCCHQLRITSSVKADLGTSIREKVETANNLIIAAKNLMNAVVLLVKTCYVASVSIERRGGSKPVQFLQWKLTAPKKKLLYSQEALDRLQDDMFRENPKHSLRSPIKELGDFRGRNLPSPDHGEN